MPPRGPAQVLVRASSAFVAVLAVPPPPSAARASTTAAAAAGAAAGHSPGSATLRSHQADSTTSSELGPGQPLQPAALPLPPPLPPPPRAALPAGAVGGAGGSPLAQRGGPAWLVPDSHLVGEAGCRDLCVAAIELRAVPKWRACKPQPRAQSDAASSAPRLAERTAPNRPPYGKTCALSSKPPATPRRPAHAPPGPCIATSAARLLTPHGPTSQARPATTSSPTRRGAPLR
jgi:hypothetical protein